MNISKHRENGLLLSEDHLAALRIPLHTWCTEHGSLDLTSAGSRDNVQYVHCLEGALSRLLMDLFTFTAILVTFREKRR